MPLGLTGDWARAPAGQGPAAHQHQGPHLAGEANAAVQPLRIAAEAQALWAFEGFETWGRHKIASTQDVMDWEPIPQQRIVQARTPFEACSCHFSRF